MEISLLELIMMISTNDNKDHFFKEDINLDESDCLQLISSYSPYDKIIFSSGPFQLNNKTSRINFEEKLINTEGLIVFYYILHDDEFFCERIENAQVLYDRLDRSIRNSFIGDFIVFKNGIKKNYLVKNTSGEILYSNKVDRRNLGELIIEWY